MYIFNKMSKPSTHYALRHKISGILMLAALLWLTISIPFVYEAKQQVIAESAAAALHSPDIPGDKDTSDNPFANTTEEKTSSNILSFSEEFLHDSHQEMPHHSVELTVSLHHAHEATYEAFHGELLCPPPNA